MRGLTFELLNAVHAQAGVRSQARRLIRGGCGRVYLNGPEPREYAGAHVSASVEYRARIPLVVPGKIELRTDTAFPARSPKTHYRAEGRQGGGFVNQRGTLRGAEGSGMLLISATNFGDLLRGHRLAAGLTQEALAERAGLSAHGIQKLERGAAHPYRDTAQRLIAALQLEPEAEANFRAAVHPVRRRGSILRGESVRPAEHNLPAALSSFVGREQELAQVMARLAGTRLLTLTGIGGCGKTRLALEMARALVQDYPDGVWLVELGPLSDSARVPHQVAAVLGVREAPQEPVLAALASALARRRLLLVLDNCEHLLNACATLIDGLLKSCLGLKVLATSREPVGISGEVAWRVPSLAIPDLQRLVALADLARIPAVQLFVERASAQTSFALSERNAEAAAQVCRSDRCRHRAGHESGRADHLCVAPSVRRAAPGWTQGSSQVSTAAPVPCRHPGSTPGAGLPKARRGRSDAGRADPLEHQRPGAVRGRPSRAWPGPSQQEHHRRHPQASPGSPGPSSAPG